MKNLKNTKKIKTIAGLSAIIGTTVLVGTTSSIMDVDNFNANNFNNNKSILPSNLKFSDFEVVNDFLDIGTTENKRKLWVSISDASNVSVQIGLDGSIQPYSQGSLKLVNSGSATAKARPRISYFDAIDDNNTKLITGNSTSNWWGSTRPVNITSTNYREITIEMPVWTPDGYSRNNLFTQPYTNDTDRISAVNNNMDVTFSTESWSGADSRWQLGRIRLLYSDNVFYKKTAQSTASISASKDVSNILPSLAIQDSKNYFRINTKNLPTHYQDSKFVDVVLTPNNDKGTVDWKITTKSNVVNGWFSTTPKTFSGTISGFKKGTLESGVFVIGQNQNQNYNLLPSQIKVSDIPKYLIFKENNAPAGSWNISNITSNDQNGTLSITILANKWYDENGILVETSKELDKYTITGFDSIDPYKATNPVEIDSNHYANATEYILNNNVSYTSSSVIQEQNGHKINGPRGFLRLHNKNEIMYFSYAGELLWKKSIPTIEFIQGGYYFSTSDKFLLLAQVNHSNLKLYSFNEKDGKINSVDFNKGGFSGGAYSYFLSKIAGTEDNAIVHAVSESTSNNLYSLALVKPSSLSITYVPIIATTTFFAVNVGAVEVNGNIYFFQIGFTPSSTSWQVRVFNNWVFEGTFDINTKSPVSYNDIKGITSRNNNNFKIDFNIKTINNETFITALAMSHYATARYPEFGNTQLQALEFKIENSKINKIWKDKSISLQHNTIDMDLWDSYWQNGQLYGKRIYYKVGNSAATSPQDFVRIDLRGIDSLSQTDINDFSSRIFSYSIPNVNSQIMPGYGDEEKYIFISWNNQGKLGKFNFNTKKPGWHTHLLETTVDVEQKYTIKDFTIEQQTTIFKKLMSEYSSNFVLSSFETTDDGITVTTAFHTSQNYTGKDLSSNPTITYELKFINFKNNKIDFSEYKIYNIFEMLNKNSAQTFVTNSLDIQTKYKDGVITDSSISEKVKNNFELQFQIYDNMDRKAISLDSSTNTWYNGEKLKNLTINDGWKKITTFNFAIKAKLVLKNPKPGTDNVDANDVQYVWDKSEFNFYNVLQKPSFGSSSNSYGETMGLINTSKMRYIVDFEAVSMKEKLKIKLESADIKKIDPEWANAVESKKIYERLGLSEVQYVAIAGGQSTSIVTISLPTISGSGAYDFSQIVSPKNKVGVTFTTAFPLNNNSNLEILFSPPANQPSPSGVKYYFEEEVFAPILIVVDTNELKNISLNGDTKDINIVSAKIDEYIRNHPFKDQLSIQFSIGASPIALDSSRPTVTKFYQEEFIDLLSKYSAKNNIRDKVIKVQFALTNGTSSQNFIISDKTQITLNTNNLKYHVNIDKYYDEIKSGKGFKLLDANGNPATTNNINDIMAPFSDLDTVTKLGSWGIDLQLSIDPNAIATDPYDSPRWTKYKLGGTIPENLGFPPKLWIRFAVVDPNSTILSLNSSVSNQQTSRIVSVDVSNLKIFIDLKTTDLDLVKISGNTKNIQIDESAVAN
ncbi:MAG: hypothetical protein ACRCRZ_00965, partial [Metamycoplasmataceae bacterium]